MAVNSNITKSVVSENIVSSRENDRIHGETLDSKLDSPSVAALAKRSSMANIQVNTQSPVRSEGGILSVGKCYGSGQADAKSSPIKPTKYSPVKSTPSKVNLLRI